MSSLEQVLYDLVSPMVEDIASLSVKTLSSLDESEIVLMVYAKSEDIARLIGRQGSMATAIRHMMSIPSRIEDKKIAIKFESY